MAPAYNVVDADAPLDLWDRYIDPGFRERPPRLVIDENGNVVIYVKRDRP